MAEQINKFDPLDFLMQDFTPALKNLWKVHFPTILGVKIPTYFARTGKRPSWTFDEVMIPHIGGQKRYIATGITYDEIEFAFTEPIDMSVSSTLISWSSLIHDNTTGLKGYPSMYKQNVTIELLDGVKQVINRWTLLGCWPKVFDFDTLDYESTEVMIDSITLRYDKAIFNF